MSKIQWTQQTWNPIIGCSKISEGCANCYAEKMAFRMSCNPKAPEEYQHVITDRKWNGKPSLVPSQLNKPLSRKKPTIFFVGSMTDVFHRKTPFCNLDRLFTIMETTEQHRFILLTKRAERMWSYMDRRRDRDMPVLPNLILGVTAENQEQANKRIPILLETPAAARFVSVEPMLGAVRLDLIKPETNVYWDALRNEYDDSKPGGSGPALDWVICGGESGPKARPMHPDWVRSLRNQCKDAEVPFFFKQWGEWAPMARKKASHMIRRDSGHVMNYVTPAKTTDEFWEPISCVGKKKAGNILDGQVHEESPAILREVQSV